MKLLKTNMQPMAVRSGSPRNKGGSCHSMFRSGFIAVVLIIVSFVGAPVIVSAQNPEVDIKPTSDTNPINPLRSKGVIPVAILGSETFDVADVDRTTLVFGPSGVSPTHKFGGHIVDVNMDGFMDLLSHYRTEEAGISSGDTDACLAGQLLDGTPFESCDDITTVP